MVVYFSMPDNQRNGKYQRNGCNDYAKVCSDFDDILIIREIFLKKNEKRTWRGEICGFF